MAAALLPADWPAPPSVRAFTTLRHGAGVSAAPFDTFNLGARCGDDPAAVARNRVELTELARLPSAPHWLRQVHGKQVERFGLPLLPPLPLAPQADFLRGAGEGWGEGMRPATAGAVSGEPARPHIPRVLPSGRPPSGHLLPRPEGSPLGGQAGEGNEQEADASVTSTSGTVLAILTADCLPVLFCARDGSEVGAAHAGWRGLAAGVLEATLAAMATPREQVVAWLGPAAGPQHYEVGIEVYDAFVAPDWAAGSAFTTTRPHHWRVDLYALARRRLTAAGVPPGNIHGGGLCTIADPQRFYSHRRDQRTGRMASLIWMDATR